jgi:hypothetical protein
MITQKNRLSIILSAIFILLLIPLVAMQFTNQVDWSTSDFLIMGILLLGTGLIIEGVFRLVKKRASGLSFAALCCWYSSLSGQSLR